MSYETKQDMVLSELRAAGPQGVPVWWLAEHCGLRCEQVRGALHRLRATQLAFCVDRGEGGWLIWQAVPDDQE